MKQILLNIRIDDNGNNIIINYEDEDNKIRKVLPNDRINNSDMEFIDNIEKLIKEKYGNL